MKKYRLITNGLGTVRTLIQHDGEYELMDLEGKEGRYAIKEEFTKAEIVNLPKGWMKHLEWVEVEEPKYYLKAQQGKKGSAYLNLRKDTCHLSLSNKDALGGGHQIQFTESEILQLPTWCQHLERILVEE